MELRRKKMITIVCISISFALVIGRFFCDKMNEMEAEKNAYTYAIGPKVL